MPSPSDPDLWYPGTSIDPRDVMDEPEPDVDGDAESECEVCHGPCPAEHMVCDDCEDLVDEMHEEVT